MLGNNTGAILALGYYGAVCWQLDIGQAPTGCLAVRPIGEVIFTAAVRLRGPCFGYFLPWLGSLVSACRGYFLAMAGLSPRPRPTEVGSRCCQLHRGHDPPQLPVLSHGQGGGPSYPNAGPGGGTLTRGGRRKYTPGPECSGSGVSGEIRLRPRSPHAFLYRALPVGEGGLPRVASWRHRASWCF